MSQSRVGRQWRAVRDDPVAAQLAGIDLGRSRIVCFVVSAACAGLAGGLMALVTRVAAPSGFTLILSLTLLMAVVLGGLGTLTGALIGAALLTLLPTYVTNAGSSLGLSDLQSAELAPLVLGLTTIAVVLPGAIGTRRVHRTGPAPTADPLNGHQRHHHHHHQRRTIMSRNHLRAALAASTAAVVLAGCGAGGRDASSGGDSEGDTTGVTDTTISVGTHQPLTGVAAPGYSEINTGMKAYFDYVNEAGGIHGRKLELTVKDDGYNPTNTSKVVDELVLKDNVFAILGGLGTPTHTAVVDFLNKEEVPDLFVSSGAQLWGNDPEARPWTFGWQPDYEIEGKIMGQWIKENKPNAKVGLFLQGDELGGDGEKGLRRYVDDQIVERVEYASGNTDIGPQISKLKASGADLVVGFNTPSYTALSQLASMKLGYDPTWMYTNVGSDPKLAGSCSPPSPRARSRAAVPSTAP
uniref:ABC transporter substrate-binding protein n=1 Tax=Janibacter limosus TaxID=53458 RepID=A0AC61U942_9MICO|nr:ABC transporter substrate-binding protein [Janibacter limosus]